MKEQNIINTFKTIQDLEEYRNKINEMCDERKKFITLCEEANNLSKKPFAYIKEAFEAISPELFKTNEGKKIMNKYSKLIKESKNLQSLHTVHENIRKAGKGDIEFFVKTLTEATWYYNGNEVSEDIKKLGRILAEGYLHIGETAKIMLPEENVNMPSLTESVEFILENKKKNNNIAKYSDAVKVIKEHILNNSEDTKNVFESVNLDALAKRLVEDFNLKYSDKLTLEEADALREISNSKDKESIFNKYKEVCSSKITEAKNNFEAKGDKDSSDRLKVVLEQISSKSFTTDTVATDICSLIELSNIFE